MPPKIKIIIWCVLLIIGLSPFFLFISCNLSAFFKGLKIFENEYRGWDAVLESTVLFWGFFWRFVLAGGILSVIAIVRICFLKQP